MTTLFAAFRNARQLNRVAARLLASSSSNAPQAVLTRSFHASAPVYKRKGGSSALKSERRAPSKAQMRRRREKVVEKREEREAKKTTARAMKTKAFLTTQQDAVVKLEQRFAGAAEALLSPDAIINTTGYPDTSDALPGGVEEALAQLEAIKAGGRAMSDHSSAQVEGAAAATTATLPVVMTASEEDCYRIARTFALAGSSDKVSDLICTVKEKNIPLSSRIYAQAMLAANNHGRYQHAIDTFQVMLKEGFEPSSDAWGFLVQAHVSLGQLEEARKVVSGLVRAGLRVTTPIYNALIEAALAEKEYGKAEELFVEMKDNGAESDIRTYALMMKTFAYTHKPERAFFLLDEMRTMDVQPDEDVFIGLLYAAATAPHHIQGYEDMLFQALDAIESYEFLPTERLYTAVITAFGRAGNGSAAMHYFDEMKQKELVPSIATYTSLLSALAKDNTVGAKYGLKKPFVLTDTTRPLTEEEKLIVEAGPEEFAKLASQGVETNVDGSRRMRIIKPTGNKAPARVKARIVGEMPTTEEIAEALRESKNAERFGEELAALDAGDADEDEDQLEARRAQLLLGRGAKDADNADDEFDLEDEDEELEELDLADDVDPDSISDDEYISQFLAELGFKESEISEGQRKALKREMQQAARARDGDDLDADLGAETGDDDDDDEVVARYYSAPRRTKQEEDDSLNSLAALLESASPERAILMDENLSDREKTSSSLAVQSQLGSSLRSWDPAFSAPSKPVAVKVSNDDMVPTIAKYANRDRSQVMSMEQILEYQKLCAFGRPEAPDYSIDIRTRQRNNIQLATQVLEEAIERKLPLNTEVLTAHMSVYADAFKFQEALACFENMKQRGLALTPQTYRTLFRMYYRTGNVPEAVKFKDNMLKEGVEPDTQTYGMLVDLLARKHKVVEALQTLEEMDKRGHQLPLKYSHALRSRCRQLQVAHPLIPKDPKEFIYEGYKIRKQARKGDSQREIQAIRSKMFIR